jgi:hypothetical protein
VPWLQDEHISGSDSQLGTVVRANRHLSRHADACVPCLARPGPCDRFDVPGPLPARLEGPSALREVPQSYHVAVAVRLELAGLVCYVDVSGLTLSHICLLRDLERRPLLIGLKFRPSILQKTSAISSPRLVLRDLGRISIGTESDVGPSVGRCMGVHN